MPNAYIPRPQVHEWSEAIGDNPEDSSLTRLLKQQRRLSRWIEENAGNMEPATAGVALYLVGVVVRLFDLAGGRLKAATWEQVRDAERRVGAAVDQLLPLDEDLPKRARAIEWRAQPHVLDEALMALFERPEKGEEEQELDLSESLKTYLMMWVATEVLDQNWAPPKGFEGESTYTYHHIEPKPRKAEGDGASDGDASAGEAAAG